MNSPSPILRVLIVDDSEVVRMGLRALLGAEPSLTITGEAASVATAVESAAAHRPDVVLLDIRLPDGTGFDACRQILQRSPATRVLVLTSVADENVVDDAIRAGAHGYLLKEVHGRSLVQAIHDVAAGKSILDPAITARVLTLMRSTAPATRDALAALSTQERRVIALIAEGKTNKEVAAAMDLTEKTVKNYLSNIFDKLHVTRRSEAAALYAKGKGGA
ncbi:MAG: response regulator transcription factor [Verrucomicrobia bacterium]|nr:response regulator transcription factor [Verrucomicrobiota bacterium]